VSNGPSKGERTIGKRDHIQGSVIGRGDIFDELGRAKKKESRRIKKKVNIGGTVKTRAGSLLGEKKTPAPTRTISL